MTSALETCIREERAKNSRLKYYRTHPWAKYRSWAASRAKRLGFPCDLKTNDFHDLWQRDNATLLKKPSIDRINPKKGYISGNCRFIEESLNKSLGARSQIKNEAQLRASSENLRKWRSEHKNMWIYRRKEKAI